MVHSRVLGHDPKCRSEKDDGFVRVTFKTEKGLEQNQSFLQENIRFFFNKKCIMLERVSGYIVEIND